MSEKSWRVLDCRSKGLERLTIIEGDRVICRIENSVSGLPLDDEDVRNAALIAQAPELLARIARLEGIPNEF